MPCHTRMKLLARGLFWLFLLEFGFMVSSSLEPGFLDFDNLPDTNFSCVGKVIGGYYADLETSCQMFHVCTIGQLDEPMDIRFLCLNGTVFDQETRVCERIDEVDCSKSEQFYSLNLELYGNTQPPILEESPETESPEQLEIVKKSTTTTSTTTPRPTPTKTPRQNYIISSPKPTAITSTRPAPPQIPQPPKPPQPQPQLHFGSNSQQNNAPSDIRFNPEQYKISLSSGGPPNIRTNINVNPNSANAHNDDGTKPISFQTFSDNNKRVIVTTHTTVYKSEKQPIVIATSASVAAPLSPHPSSKPQEHNNDSDEDYDAELSDSTEDSYSFGYHSQQHQPETLKLSAFQPQTESPPKSYQFRPGFRPSQPLEDSYKPSTYRSVFHPATNNPLKINYNHRGQHGPTTYRNHYGYFHQGPTKLEKQRLHSIPMLPPLTFSSPAPFSLNRHIETKRFIDHRAQQQHTQSQQASQQHIHHHQPPRIVISASASVSDASGRKFNYSLGTIGDTRFFGNAPQSYDDYKEADVSADPFYHDVPKIRLKRQIREPPAQHAKLPENLDYDGEKEAIDVLKFLFNWYNTHEMSTPKSIENIPIRSETITEINDALTPQSTHPQDNYPRQQLKHQDQQYQEQQQAQGHVDYVYEDYDHQYSTQNKQPEQFHPPKYAHLHQRDDFQKPYLSLQLLKPPFEQRQDQDQEFQNKLTSNLPTLTSSTITPPTTTRTTSRYTTTTTTPIPIPDNHYYDYVDDNYEPLTYQEPPKNNKEIAKNNYNLKTHQVQEFNTNTKEYNNPQEYIVSQQDDKEERNYSLPEYVDDNYEPIVYQHQDQTVSVNVPTTVETLTTLKEPTVLPNTSGVFSNGNDFKEVPIYTRPGHTVNDNQQGPNYKEYNVEYSNNDGFKLGERKSESEKTTTERIQTTLNDVSTSAAIEPLNNPQIEDKEYPMYGQRSNTEIVPGTDQGKVEDYQQVLGILGITTRSPPVNEQKRQKVNRGRGKARFSLKEVDDAAYRRKPVKSDNYSTYPILPSIEPTLPTTTTTTTTTTLTPATTTTTFIEPSKSVEPLNYSTSEQYQSTTENFRYTMSINRRTEEIPTTTSSVNPLPSTNYATPSAFYESSTIPYLNTYLDLEKEKPDDTYVKLGETTTQTVAMTDVMSTTTPFPTTIGKTVDFESYTTDEGVTNPFMTTVQIQDLVEKVESSTTSENFGNQQEEQEVTVTSALGSTVTVPTTLIFQIDSRNESDSSTASVPLHSSTYSVPIEEVTVTNLGSRTDMPYKEDDEEGKTIRVNNKTALTTVMLTTQMPTTTTSKTTLAPTSFTKNSVYSNGRNSRRRSKTRYRTFTSSARTTTTSTTASSINYDTNFPPSDSAFTSTTSNFPTSLTSSSVTTATPPTTFFTSTLPTTFSNYRKPSLNQEIIDVIKHKMASTDGQHPSHSKIEFNINAYTANLAYRAKTTPLTFINDTSHLPRKLNHSDDMIATHQPISKSAKPTLSNENVKQDRLPTTPIFQSTAINVRKQVRHRKYTFNCFDREINRFYSDPRDCRLFHYCTRGFTRTQYLDMKFVCDLGTFFDDVQLICTETKPARCV